jgi:hypothetical protein
MSQRTLWGSVRLLLKAVGRRPAAITDRGAGHVVRAVAREEHDEAGDFLRVVNRPVAASLDCWAMTACAETPVAFAALPATPR